jgi:hypothetical protein
MIYYVLTRLAQFHRHLIQILLLWTQKNLMCSFNKSECVVDLEFMWLNVLF